MCVLGPSVAVYMCRGRIHVDQFSTAEPTVRVVSPAEPAAEFHQLRELARAFGVRTLRQSIERAAKEPWSATIRRRANERKNCSTRSERFGSSDGCGCSGCWPKSQRTL